MTNPLAAGFRPSLRANQHAIPNANIAAPATRATINVIGVSSVEENRIFIRKEGRTNNVIPVVDSIIEVKVRMFFI